MQCFTRSLKFRDNRAIYINNADLMWNRDQIFSVSVEPIQYKNIIKTALIPIEEVIGKRFVYQPKDAIIRIIVEESPNFSGATMAGKTILLMNKMRPNFLIRTSNTVPINKTNGTIVHEFLHVLGFLHTHTCQTRRNGTWNAWNVLPACHEIN